MSDQLTMAERHDLAERVEAELSKRERETGLDFFQTDDRFTITTYSPSIARSLLKHGEATIEWVYVTDEGRVKTPQDLTDRAVTIEGVQVTLPVGTLTIKGTVRASNADSGIVSTPDEADGIRERFN